MRYVFKMDIYTDGDFTFPFVPRGMEWENYNYSFEKIYKTRESAKEDILNICNFMREQINTHRDYVKEDWYRCIDEFVQELKESGDAAYSDMGGNYDGTLLSFYTLPDYYNCTFYVTDDELEMLCRNHKKVSDEMIKEAVLNLYRKD